MGFDGTVIGFQLPEDGVNNHPNTQEQELICECINTVYCRTVGKQMTVRNVLHGMYGIQKHYVYLKILPVTTF